MKKKILELTNFSAGGCGVFGRVKQEAGLLKKKGYDVKIFSSNLEKGTNRIVQKEDEIFGVKIKRFPAKRLGGESFMKWDFEKAALEYKPDIIIAHGYRHIHTKKAVEVSKKLNCKLFLVTHAPFARGKESRGFISNWVVKIYDKMIGPRVLKKYDKILTISNWEKHYLDKLKVISDKIEYVPNGIDEFFFNEKRKGREKKKIIYMGRISPIKNLETLIKSFAHIKNKELKLEIIGPAEKDYLIKLKKIIKENRLENFVEIIDKKYDKKEFIKSVDESLIFCLPSLSEGMPQALIEAMAREKIVLASNNTASTELISHGKNGFLFKIGDERNCAREIELILDISERNKKKIKIQARKDVEKFNWKNVINKLVKIIEN